MDGGWISGGDRSMNWIDFTVGFFVALALVSVLLYKLFPLITKKKRLSRKARELMRYYKRVKKKEAKEKEKDRQ